MLLLTQASQVLHGPGQASSLHPGGETPRPTTELEKETATHSSILA